MDTHDPKPWKLQKKGMWNHEMRKINTVHFAFCNSFLSGQLDMFIWHQNMIIPKKLVEKDN